MPLSPQELDSLRPPLLEGLRTLQAAWDSPTRPGAGAGAEENVTGPDAAQGEARVPFGWPLEPETLTERLLAYTAELFRFNEKLGLVGSEPREFVQAHLLDSLAPIGVLPESSRARFLRGAAALDVGSGAGLPGIPLALSFPELKMTLLDRSGRRCGFLRNAVAILGRRDIEVFPGTVREARPSLAGSAELLLARAFHPLGVGVYEHLDCLLAAGGEMLLYKGRLEQAEEELSRLREELQEQGREPPEALLRKVEVPALSRERSVLVLRRSV